MGETQPGWYPDPSGKPGKLYWDGQAWRSPPNTPIAPAKNPTGWAVLLLFALVFAGVFACNHMGKSDDSTASSTPTTYSPEETQASVVSTCQDAVKKSLKDPDSAKFGDDWKAWKITSGGTPPVGMSYNPAGGDVYYNACGQVNAKNSFGGYAGDEPYYCDVVVTTAGNIHAQAKSMADLLNTPPTT